MHVEDIINNIHLLIYFFHKISTNKYYPLQCGRVIYYKIMYFLGIIGLITVVRAWQLLSSGAVTPDTVTSVEISDDGSQLAVGTDAPNIVIVDTATYVTSTVASGSAPVVIAASVAGYYAVLGTTISTDVYIVDGFTSLLTTISTSHAQITGLDFSADGGELLICGQDPQFSIWETGNWSMMNESLPNGRTAFACQFSQDGWVGIGTTSGVAVFNADLVQQGSTTANTSDTSTLAFGDVGNEYVFGNVNGDCYSGDSLLSNEGVSIGASAYFGEYLMFGTDDLLIYYSQTEELLFNFTHGSDIIAIHPSNNQTFLYVITSDGTLFIYEQTQLNITINSTNTTNVTTNTSTNTSTNTTTNTTNTTTNTTTSDNCLERVYNSSTNTSQCVCGLGWYYSSLEDDCVDCEVMEGCGMCSDNSTCSYCMPAYYLHNNLCSKCSTLPGCLLCSDGGECTSCHPSFYLNSANECIKCSSEVEKCSSCSSSTTCSSCISGYFLNATTQQCDPCEHNCLACSESQCFICVVGYEAIEGECVLCDYGCEYCNGGVCGACVDGYTFIDGQCVDVGSYVSEVDVRYGCVFVGENRVKHWVKVKDSEFILVQDNQFVNVSIVLENGEELKSAKISDVGWCAYHACVFFYTSVGEEVINGLFSQMSVSRRLLASVAQAYTLTIPQTLIQQLIGQSNHQGSITVEYSLADAAFLGSVLPYVDVYYYRLIGMLLLGAMMLGYGVKSLVIGGDEGEVLPHIMAIKCAILINGVQHVQFYDYCAGFMVADFYWWNSVIGEVLGDASDYSPDNYRLLFANMNFGSTYVVAGGVCVLLALIGLGIRICNKQKSNSWLKFVYWTFVVGVGVSGCAALQGALYNPLFQFSVNAFFYLFGFFVYFFFTLYTFYWVCKNSSQHIDKLRVWVKCTCLSLAYSSPVLWTTLLLSADIALIAHEYNTTRGKYYSRMKVKPQIWAIQHVLVNVGCAFIFYLPQILLSIIIVSVILMVVLGLDVYLHYHECTFLRQKQATQKATSLKHHETLHSMQEPSLSYDISSSHYYDKSERQQQI